MDSILEMWERAPNGEQLQKALMQEQEERKKAAIPKSAIIDPTNSYGVGGTRSKQAIVPFSTLRRMAQVPAIAAILLTRKNQVARFARRPRFDGDIGFRIGLKDTKAKMTDAQQKKAHEMEEFFLKTGGIKNKKRKDNFNAFLRKIVDDTLTLDVMAWENVPNHAGGLSEIWAVDGTTIELVSNAPVSDEFQPYVYVPETKRGHKVEGDIAYVQRLDGRIVAEYTEEELTYSVRNPKTDIYTTDFGTSELEVLMEIVTGILNGIRYNTTYFTHSHVPQGVLEIVGKYKDEHLESFKRHWKNLTSGASGKWAVPVMALSEGQGIKWTPFKNSNQDMQFNEFLEFLFNVACAVYQIDPNEVGFKSWTSKSGGMSQSDNTEEKMDKSKDKGLIPLMNFLSDNFNEIVDSMDDEFAFYWVGLDEDDEDRRAERQEKAINSGIKTVAMVWAENDVDIEEIKKQNGGELPKWAHAPANAQLIQVFMAESGLGQQAQPGDPNDPNAEADENQAQRDHEQVQADDSHGKDLEKQDDSHEKQLEIMDKQHEQTVEQKKLDQQHQIKMSQMQAATAEKQDKAKAKDAKGKDDGKPSEDPEDKHEKQLEVMDKEHAQSMKEKKADQEHETKIEKMKAQAAKATKTLKKGLDTSEAIEGVINITITWDDY